MEQWWPVPGYEGYYEISDQARVRSVDRWVERAPEGRKAYRQLQPGRTMRVQVSGPEAWYVQLWREGTWTRPEVRQLARSVFPGLVLPGVPARPYVPPGEKRCYRCRRVLPRTAEEFPRDSSNRDGLSSLCKPCNRAAQAEYRAEVRARVFAHYGTACACCGSTEELTIDHAGGGGTEHREQLFGGSHAGGPFYRWLVREGFPDGYQALCAPCNNSKGDGRLCLLHGDDGRLAGLRRMAQAGMAQGDIGEALGLTQTAVSRLMRERLGMVRGRGNRQAIVPA